jgi:spore maturation protein CgeB
MKIVLFCHSLLSDWNHGNAHFLRGLSTALVRRGHSVVGFEPEDAWSVRNLQADAGELPLRQFRERYPLLEVLRYRGLPDLDSALDDADLVLVHEWTEPELVRAVGERRRRSGARFRLLFHDTHHRLVSDPAAIERFDLAGYDGILAFGEALSERYRRLGWSRRVWTFHEAADTNVFRPMPELPRTDDIVWVGNWGDDERTAELAEFLFEPVRKLGLRGTVHGVRYPAAGVEAITRAGLTYRGWLANYRVPEVFARHRVTVHVPRGPYARMLPGIPTIRVFEALASGIPLVCAPWADDESLFRPDDFLMARDGRAMTEALRLLSNDAAAAAELSARGRETLLARHTCDHRATELLQIVAELQGEASAATETSATEASTWV